MEQSNFFPSRTVKKGSRDEKTVKKDLRDFRHKSSTDLKNAQESTKNIEFWRELDTIAKEAITRLYEEKTGIKFGEEAHGTAYILPIDRGAGLVSKEETGGSVSAVRDAITIFVPSAGDPENYKRLVSLFHERFHFVGRKAVTAKMEKKRGFFPWVTHTNVTLQDAQLGFITKGKEIRGEGLEEAITHFYSENMLRNSTDPRLLEIRKNALIDVLQPAAAHPEVISLITTVKSTSLEQFNLIEQRLKTSKEMFAEREIVSYRLYEVLLARAEKLGLKAEFEKEALIARVMPEKTKQFFDLLKVVVGDEVQARKIYTLRTDNLDEMKSFVNQLSINSSV